MNAKKLKPHKIRPNIKPLKPMVKYIFVVGGVISGVGKGVAAASIGRILISKGYNVSAVKIDPYINVDAGTMNPTEHGEVFVTEDGDETDQDIGNYERFLNKNIYRENYMTTGRVYKAVIEKERNLEYQGKCVEVIPHIPLEVRDRIEKAVQKTGAEIMIIEIGGTVGEYQNLLFLEAARVMRMHNPKDVIFVMVSYLPIPFKVGEMKTKPTQHAVRELYAAGIQPDFILARSSRPLDEKRKQKIAINCNIPIENVISSPDVESIYDVPINYEKENLGNRILEKLSLEQKIADLKDWRTMSEALNNATEDVKIAIVGKYFATGEFSLGDAYISVIEAIKHGCINNNCKAQIDWISTDDIEKNGVEILKKFHGIIIPQGWGSRGSEDKIKAIEYARTNNIPFLGLCYGMQMAVIEFARNVCKLENANTQEADSATTHPVIHIMPGQKEFLAKKQYGGTIRLGGWPCKIKEGTKLANIYKNQMNDEQIITERHRHRYEFNNEYRAQLESAGLTISGTSPDGSLVEAIEISNHKFFIASQFHPEYISRPLDPHPLFEAFIKACK